MKKKYVVTVDRWIGTTFHKKGSTVEMTEREARYLVLDQTLELATADEKDFPDVSDKPAAGDDE